MSPFIIFKLGIVYHHLSRLTSRYLEFIYICFTGKCGILYIVICFLFAFVMI